MPDFDDPRWERPEATRPIFEPRPRETSGLGLGIAVVAALALAVAGWFWFRRTPPQPAEAAPQAAPADASVPAAAGAPRALPALDASDELVRALAIRLSAHPELAAWLVNDALVRRFVAAVINVAEGTSPESHLRFLRPRAGFGIRESAGRLYLEESSFRRYDLATEVFVSLDPAAAAEIFRELHPLLDEAYRELGRPERSFDQTLALAIGELTGAPLPSPPFEVVPQGTVYAWEDRDLEQLSAAQKHLLRTGPANSRRIQEKLRELAAALGLAAG